MPLRRKRKKTKGYQFISSREVKHLVRWKGKKKAPLVRRVVYYKRGKHYARSKGRMRRITWR